MSYGRTLSRVEAYFDGTATHTWARLTSDAPVSRIRETVRKGRDRMRAHLLDRLPADLRGARVLDAGCGAGQMTLALAERGAEVVATDISPRLLGIARDRLPSELTGRVMFVAGDMLDPVLGRFDHVVAMDSLLYYTRADVAQAIGTLSRRTSGRIVFTLAPRTPLLMAMWRAGQLCPRSNRSPTMVPHAPAAIAEALRKAGVPGHLAVQERISSGFYISQAMEFTS